MSYINNLFLEDKNLLSTYSVKARIQIAENTPSYLHSGEYLSFKLKVASPHEAIAGLIVLSLFTKERDNTIRQEFLEELGQRLFCYNYEGKWKVVQEILEQPLTPFNIVTTVVRELSLRELKGNVLPLVPLLAENYKIVVRQVHVVKRPKKVRYPQRKRGYDDKGSLRLAHEIHELWEHDGPNPIRIDRRNNIKLARNRYYWVPTKDWRKLYE